MILIEMYSSSNCLVKDCFINAAAAVAVAAVVDRLREYVRTGCKENRLTSARAASPLDMPGTLLLPPFTRLTTAEGLERSEKRIYTPSARRI